MIFDGVPPEPSGYTIEQPARIALDLDGVRSGLSSKHHSLGSGNARSVTVVESDGRTRIIISMSELVGYSSRVSDNSLYILVGEDETGSGSVASSGYSTMLVSESLEATVAKLPPMALRRDPSDSSARIVAPRDTSA